jgi:hypothetical protein
MADILQTLLDKTNATTSDSTIIKSTAGIEDITFSVELTSILNAGTTWQVHIDTTNVSETALQSDNAYWTLLMSFDSKATGATVPFFQIKSILDQALLKDPGQFLRIRVVIAGGTPSVSYKVRWTYKLRITS